MTFTLHLLGGARIEDGRGPLQGRATQRLRLALLAFLAASPRGTSTREKLVRVLWSDSDSGRRLLTEALYVFRKELADDVVLASGDEVRLNPAVLACDLVRFHDAIASRDWRRAVAWYGGAFLDGFNDNDLPAFARWAEGEREAVGRAYARALEALAEEREREGDAHGAAEWWGRLAVHDAYSSRVALRLIGALSLAGERERALRFATSFAARMRDEEIEPAPEVTAAAERLRAQPAPLTAPPPTAPSISASLRNTPDLSAEFELIRPIGAGSVANVFLAREPALGRLVAIKVLAERWVGDPIMRQRFEREARAAARIHHPNVATVFRVGHTEEGAPYIMLPYVSGGSLEDRQAAAGPPSISEAKRYFAQLAAGLEAAHRLGIVHRDVRPANILFDRETDRVLLTDFGLAAVLESRYDPAQRLTRPGEALGDPTYASPEQLRGEPVSERADVYSLGVVAFELVTGRLPFDAVTAFQKTAAHVRLQPHSASTFRAEIDVELDDLIRRCLHKRAEQRPFTADVCEALGWV